jgi:hypothetical protein
VLKFAERFKWFTVTEKTKIRVFWDVAPRGVDEVGDDHCPDDGRQYAPLKGRSTPTRPHGATSRKAVVFALAAVRTWNLTTEKTFFTCLSVCLIALFVSLEEIVEEKHLKSLTPG